MDPRKNGNGENTFKSNDHIFTSFFAVFAPWEAMSELWVGKFMQAARCCHAKITPNILGRTEIQFLYCTRAGLYDGRKKKWMNRLLSVNEHKLINRTLNPSSGFSLVIRAAITCPHGVGGLGGLSKSMGMLSQGLRRYKVRIDLIRYKGIPIAICSWAAGKFTSDTISVQGCSTCHLERKLN